MVILVASLRELIQERNYDDISVTDISEWADIIRNTFYNHFETKDALLLSIVEDAIEAMFKGIDLAQIIQWQKGKKPVGHKKHYSSLFHQTDDGILLKLGLERFAPQVFRHYANSQKQIVKQLEPFAAYEDSSLRMLNLFVAGGTLALVETYLQGGFEQQGETMDELVAVLVKALIGDDTFVENLNRLCAG